MKRRTLGFNMGIYDGGDGGVLSVTLQVVGENVEVIFKKYDDGG